MRFPDSQWGKHLEDFESSADYVTCFKTLAIDS
jgi:hypothetical protein